MQADRERRRRARRTSTPRTYSRTVIRTPASASRRCSRPSTCRARSRAHASARITSSTASVADRRSRPTGRRRARRRPASTVSTMSRNRIRPVVEGVDAHLVGRVVDGRVGRRPASPTSPRQPHGGERLVVQRARTPRSRRSSSRTRDGGVGHPLRPAQAQGDRQPHARRRAWASGRPVDELDHRVDRSDCGCTTTSIRSNGMSNSRCASMTSRPLLTRVARVGRDDRAHVARSGGPAPAAGVTSRSDARERAAERPAARGQHQPAYLVGPPAAQALGDRRVLGVHRHDLPGRGRGLDQRAADDERLLVGQRERAAGGERGQRRRAGRSSR